MAMLDILTMPDPVLRKKCAPVTAVDDAVRALLTDMLETMYEAPGIGLAAPQVGVESRVIVCDVAGEEEEPAPLMLVNPEIVAASEALQPSHEGCLSLPDVFDDIERHAEVTVRYLDEMGAQKTVTADGLLAACLQHEIDHLNGVLFIDHLSKLKRDRILKGLKKAKRAEAATAE